MFSKRFKSKHISDSPSMLQTLREISVEIGSKNNGFEKEIKTCQIFDEIMKTFDEMFTRFWVWSGARLSPIVFTSFYFSRLPQNLYEFLNFSAFDFKFDEGSCATLPPIAFRPRVHLQPGSWSVARSRAQTPTCLPGSIHENRLQKAMNTDGFFPN